MNDLILSIGILLLWVLFFLIPVFIASRRKYLAPIIVICIVGLIGGFLGLLAWGSDGGSYLVLFGMGFWLIALIWSLAAPKKSKTEEWINTCDKCGFKKAFTQPLKLYKCPQCNHENVNS